MNSNAVDLSVTIGKMKLKNPVMYRRHKKYLLDNGINNINDIIMIL